jgi:PKD repeat protein
MCRPFFRVRLPWLALGLLLATVVGCNRDNGSPADEDAGAASRTAPSPSPRDVRPTGGVEKKALPPTVPPASTAAADDADVGSPLVTADVDADTGGAPFTANFTATVDGGPKGLRYRWDFGDNSPPVATLHAQHTYKTSGEYVAKFSVIGPPGSEVGETREVNIEVTEEGFEVDIETDSDVGTAPLTVEFNARLDDDLPGPMAFHWEFGDGARDAGNPTKHVYRLPGTYTATITVTNAQGQRANQEVEITVDAPDDTEQSEE